MNENLNNNIKTLFLITVVVDDRKSVQCLLKWRTWKKYEKTYNGEPHKRRFLVLEPKFNCCFVQFSSNLWLHHILVVYVKLCRHYALATLTKTLKYVAYITTCLFHGILLTACQVLAFIVEFKKLFQLLPSEISPINMEKL